MYRRNLSFFYRFKNFIIVLIDLIFDTDSSLHLLSHEKSTVGY